MYFGMNRRGRIMSDIILSIYIPTYNRSNKVANQLEFLICEIDKISAIEARKIEIIVNNNCSTDDTEEKVFEIIKETRIKYHANNINLGIVGNAYAALEHTHGKYVWIISDDDILHEGIIKRTLEIIEGNSHISYIFLNYSDNISTDDGLYNGPEGIIADGSSVLANRKYRHNFTTLVFTTSSIYLRECLAETIENLPLTTRESYGWSGYASLTALKRGNAFFDRKVWVNYGITKSWEDFESEAYMGEIRALAKLNKVGYTRREIRQIVKAWIVSIRIVDILAYCLLWKSHKYKQFINEYLFCIRKAPGYVIKASCKLVGKLIQKVKNGNLVWDR